MKAKCLLMRKSQVCECEINRVSKFLKRRGEGCVRESDNERVKERKACDTSTQVLAHAFDRPKSVVDLYQMMGITKLSRAVV